MKYFKKKEVTEKKALGKSVLPEQQQQSCGKTIHHTLHFTPSIFIFPSKFPTPHQCQPLLLVLLVWRTTSTPPSECQHQVLMLLNGIFLMDFILRHLAGVLELFLSSHPFHCSDFLLKLTDTLKVRTEMTRKHMAVDVVVLVQTTANLH